MERSPDERTRLLSPTVQVAETAPITYEDESEYLHVEIPAVHTAEDSSIQFSTSIALHQCEKTVLKPYELLLAVLGWRPILSNTTMLRRFCNLIYLLLIVGLLPASYAMKIVACDSSISSPLPSNNSPEEPMLPVEPSNGHCHHLLTMFLLPESIHFLAYVYLFYHFRVQETEQLSSLMETVFLQSCNSQGVRNSQKQLVKRLRIFLALGIVWILLTLTSSALHVADDQQRPTGYYTYSSWQMALIVCGHFIMNLVYMAVILNYCTQCQLLIHFVHYILQGIEERSLQLKTVMKDVYTLKRFVSKLNGQMGTATSLCVFSFLTLFFTGFFGMFVHNFDIHPKPGRISWTHAVIFSLIWFLALTSVLFQASRLTRFCYKLRFAGLQVRLFGYRDSSQIDLDSFLNFLLAAKMEAKLFAIPISRRFIIGLPSAAALILILLVQLDPSVRSAIKI
eukprot:m.8719 g.8719  ORF g.8719 m.8719 type:complete len:452 (+) comp20797_c0_seq1:95-1450(+)